MPSLDTIREVTIKAKLEGFDQAEASAKKVDAATQSLTRSTGTLEGSWERFTRQTTSASGALDRLQRSIDPVYKSTQALEKGQLTLGRAFDQGRVSIDEHSRLTDLLKTKYSVLGDESGKLAKSSGLTTQEFLILGGAARRAFDSVVAGQSPFRALTMEAGHLGAAVGEDGVSGLLSRAASSAAGFATSILPIAGPIGVVAGAAALAGKAFLDYDDAQKSVERSIAGIGRASGTTAGQIDAIAHASASAGGVSVSAARSMGAEFAATGRIGSAMIGDLIKVSRNYAVTAGVDLPTATHDLAAAFADPTKGATDLNKSLGFLSAASLENIRSLQAEGNMLGAQQALRDGLNSSVLKYTDQINILTRGYEAAKRAGADFYDMIGHGVATMIGQDPLEERLKRAKKELEDLKAQAAHPGILGYIPSLSNMNPAIAEAQKRADTLQAESDKRTKASADAVARRSSLEADSITRGLFPARTDIDTLVTERTRLQEALKSPLQLADPVGTQHALELINEQLAAGGTQARDLAKAAHDAFNASSLLPYQAGLAAIEVKYRDLREKAGGRPDVLAGIGKAQADEIATYNQQQIATPIRDANLALNDQIRSLTVQRDSFLAGTEASAAMAAKQQMLNQYLRENKPITDEVSKGIEDYAARAGKAAKANEDLQRAQQKLTGGMDELRSTSSGTLTGIFSDARQGKDPTANITASLGRLGDQMFDRTVSKPLTDSLLGFAGKSGGGLLGGALSSLFGSAPAARAAPAPASANDNAEGEAGVPDQPCDAVEPPELHQPASAVAA